MDFETSEVDFLRPLIDKYRCPVPVSSIGEDWFAKIPMPDKKVIGEEVIYLRRPLQGEYGEFLALCRLIWVLKLTNIPMLYNPIRLHRRNTLYVMPPSFGIEADAMDLCMAAPRVGSGQMTFLFGKFFKDATQERWIAMTKEMPPPGTAYRTQFPDEDPENSELVYKMRADFHNWGKSECLIRHIFDVPGESIEGDWTKMMKDFDDFRTREMVNHDDPDSIMAYIKSRAQKNFVDLTDSRLTLESPVIQKWLDTLSPKSYDDPKYGKKVETAIMVINNVVGQYTNDSSGAYGAKTVFTDLSGVKGVEFRHFNPDGIKRLTASWNFSIAKKDENNPTIHYWIDFWKRSALRARITNVAFKPWPISNPGAREYPPDAKYQTNREVNSFSGYGFTLDELKAAFLDPCYSQTVGRFEKLIKEGFCSNNHDWMNWLINWLAHIVQKPGDKTQVAVIIKTKKGIGKGFIARVLDRIFGKNFLFVPGRGLDDQFNSHLADRLVVFIDELNPDSFGSSNIDIIKSMITERNGLTHKKFQDQTVSANLSNFIAATNNEVDLTLTYDNRRFVILEGTHVWSPVQIREWKPFIEQMWTDFISGPDVEKNNWLRVRCVFYYLMTRDIRRFVPFKEIPVTDYMQKLMERSIPVVHNWWRFIINRGHVASNQTPFSDPSCLTWTGFDLYAEFKKSQDFAVLFDKDKKKSSKLALKDFTDSLWEVAAITRETGSETFKFQSWADQIQKWNSSYPYSKIEHRRGESVSPFVASKIAEMEETIIDQEISCLSDKEVRYALQRLKDECEEHGLKITVNQSFLKRKASDTSDLVVIDDSNKKRKI